MPTLSVWETLAFTTDLRLPESFSKADKEVLMNEALTNMGLQKVKHSQVWGPLSARECILSDLNPQSWAAQACTSMISQDQMPYLCM